MAWRRGWVSVPLTNSKQARTHIIRTSYETDFLETRFIVNYNFELSLYQLTISATEFGTEYFYFLFNSFYESSFS